MYHSYKDNGGSEVFVFIKEDGTIGELKYYVNGSKIIIEDFKETIPGYNNIISIVHSDDFGAKSYRLIDINGNVYNAPF